MSGLPQQRLTEIRERVEAATTGPWHVEDNQRDLNRWVVSSEHPGLDANLGYLGNNNQADAEFIAHAPTDMRDLLAEVERLTALTAECSCGTPGVGDFDGPQADCPIHGAIRGLQEAHAEVERLTAERDVWKRRAEVNQEIRRNNAEDADRARRAADRSRTLAEERGQEINRLQRELKAAADTIEGLDDGNGFRQRWTDLTAEIQRQQKAWDRQRLRLRATTLREAADDLASRMPPASDRDLSEYEEAFKDAVTDLRNRADEIGGAS